MNDFDHQLADLAADGKISGEDVAEVQTFRRFLAARVPRHPKTSDERALRRAWLPWLTGEGDPPPLDGVTSGDSTELG